MNEGNGKELSIVSFDAKSFAEFTLEEIRDFYLQQNKDKTTTDFQRETVALYNTADFSGDQAAQRLFDAYAAGETTNLPGALLVIAMAFCFEAMKYIKGGELNKAWPCLAEARFYLGWLSAGSVRVRSMQEIAKKTREDMARSGGVKRNEAKYKAVKDLVESLAHSLCPPKGGWKSRAQAARAIKDQLEKDGNYRPLSDITGQKTIDEWLANSESARELFKKNP